MKQLDIFELRREFVHMITGILVILFVMFLPYAQVVGLVLLIIGSFVSFLATQYDVPVITPALCKFERSCNKGFPGKGVIFFFVGSLLCLQLFEKDIALASIIILTFSDPISHFVGANFGKTALFNKRKYIEGTIVGIIVGGIFACFFVNPSLAFCGAGAAMFLECVEVAMASKTLDDNLIIPLSAGTVMYLMRLSFGI